MSDMTVCNHEDYIVEQHVRCPDCGMTALEMELIQQLVGLERELALCKPFLKENETPAMCIARNRTDVEQVIRMCADEMKKREAVEAENARLRETAEKQRAILNNYSLAPDIYKLLRQLHEQILGVGDE